MAGAAPLQAVAPTVHAKGPVLSRCSACCSPGRHRRGRRSAARRPCGGTTPGAHLRPSRRVYDQILPPSQPTHGFHYKTPARGMPRAAPRDLMRRAPAAAAAVRRRALQRPVLQVILTPAPSLQAHRKPRKPRLRAISAELVETAGCAAFRTAARACPATEPARAARQRAGRSQGGPAAAAATRRRLPATPLCGQAQ